MLAESSFAQKISGRLSAVSIAETKPMSFAGRAASTGARLSNLPVPPAQGKPKASCRLLRQIILEAYLLGSDELSEAEEIAHSLSKDLEQVLVSSGYMSPELVKLCLSSITYLEAGLITEALAASALNMSWSKQVSFEEGLKYFGWGW